jgi:hypothetical protein
MTHYSTDAPPSVPSLLYVKASDGAMGRRAGKREVEFYSAIAPVTADSPAPPCYHAAYDAESGAYHLLLEDLSQTHVTVEREAPAARADVERMLDVLAPFHARWWGDARLETVGLVDEEIVQNEFNPDFAGFVDYMGDRLSGERRSIYERVLTTFPGLLAERLVPGRGLTLIHDDAHVWNFVLPRNPEGQVYLVDWQQWGVSAGLCDVAYMIALFWYPERRRRMERDLVRYYHDRLLERGVEDYGWDACWQDYRLFAVRNLLVPLWAWSAGGPHWGFHRWLQLEKALLAYRDLGCSELLGKA